MSLDMQVLRTAKAAVDEGLLNADDYDHVKSALVKALSIKGGVDAGFLTEDDLAEARREFFVSAGMPGLGGGGLAPRGRPQQGSTGQLQDQQQQYQQQTPKPPLGPSNGDLQRELSTGNTSMSPARRQAPQIAIPDKTGSPASTGGRTPASAAATPSRRSTGGAPAQVSTRGGGAAAVKNKKSMSGISVHPDAVNIVWELRVKKQYRWVVFRIAATGSEVVIETQADPSSNWAEFIEHVPATECRYGVYDYEYVNSEGVTYGKLVFLSWAPDTASTKAKMQHASTKDLFRGLLEGVSVELHATDPADMDEAVVRERVAATVARK